MTIKVKDITPNAVVEKVAALSDDELDELCEAAEKAILDGNGFGWLTPPPRRVLESYWRGVLLMPQDRKSTSELQSLMRISYAVFCLKKKKLTKNKTTRHKENNNP